MPPCAGAMKAKELASFLKRYALDSPAQDPDASKQESAGKPDAEAEDSEDPKDKAVPQVSCMRLLTCFLISFSLERTGHLPMLQRQVLLHSCRGLWGPA